MYTQRREDEGRSIPQNYSGNAFRYPPIGEPIPEALAKEDKNKASSLLPLVKDGGETMQDDVQDDVQDNVQDVTAEHSIREMRLPIGRREAWGSEELLLLGLCLLLGGDGHSFFRRGGGWGDVMPYLLFLLFFG